MNSLLVISIFVACFLGTHAFPSLNAPVACKNVTGKAYPAACPRANDPGSFTRCCEVNGQPSCCAATQDATRDKDRFHFQCPSVYRTHNVPQCPRSYDPDDYIICCTETNTIFGVTTITYKCCSSELLAGWAIAVIVVALIIFISLITLCCCCCCSCCFLAQRREQRGYVIIRN